MNHQMIIMQIIQNETLPIDEKISLSSLGYQKKVYFAINKKKFYKY